MVFRFRVWLINLGDSLGIQSWTDYVWLNVQMDLNMDMDLHLYNILQVRHWHQCQHPDFRFQFL